MARYQLKGTFVDQSGNAVADGTASITLTATGDAAKAYDSKSGGSTVSSVSSSDNGYFEAFIDEADYNSSELFSLTLSRSGFQSQQIDNIMVIPEVTLNGTQTLSNKTIEDTLVCSSDLTVAGDFTITGKFTASSDLDVTGNLSTSGNFTLNGNLSSSGNATFQNLVTCSSGLTPNHIYGTIGSSSGTFSQPILTSPFVADFTNATQDHLSSSGGGTLAGFAIQTVLSQSSSDITGATNVPIDDTRPQVGEMNLFSDLNVTIIPTDASNNLIIHANCFMSSTGATDNLAIAVFKDADSTALAATLSWASAAEVRESMSLMHEISAGSTISQTFKFYFAAGNGDATVSGTKAGGRLLGGSASASLSVTEIQS